MCVRTNTGDKHIHLQLRTHSFVSFLQVVRGGLVPCFFSITTIRFWLKFQVQAKLIVPPPPSSTTSLLLHLVYFDRADIAAYQPTLLLKGPSDTLVPS